MRNVPALAPVPPVAASAASSCARSERALLADGMPVALGARAFDLLVAFVDRPGTLITKDDLLATVWPGLVVEENNLQVQVSTLRKILGPGALATIPGRGYRFNLAVASENPVAPSSQPRIGALGPAPVDPRSCNRMRAPIFLRGCRCSTDAPTIVARSWRCCATSGRHDHRLRRHRQDAGRASGGKANRTGARDRLSGWRLVGGACGARRRRARAVGSGAGDGRSRSPATARTALTLRSQLAAQRALLVLDNCEHLADAVAALVDAVTAGAPRVSILVTSQETLRAADEHVYRLGGLAVPDAADAQLAVAVRCGRAVRRARAGRRSALRADGGQFAGGDRNLPAPRRHSARDRARGRAAAAARRRGIARAAARALQPAHRRRARRSAPSPDAARDAGMEPRASHARRADRVPATGRLRRRLHAGGGSARRERRAHRPVDDARSPRRAGRQIAGAGRRRSRPALPDAGDDARVRARAARRSRRNAGDAAPPRARGACLAGAVRAVRMALARQAPASCPRRRSSSTTCARRSNGRTRPATARSPWRSPACRTASGGRRSTWPRASRAVSRCAGTSTPACRRTAAARFWLTIAQARRLFDPTRKLRRRGARGRAVPRARRRSALLRGADLRCRAGHAFRDASRRWKRRSTRPRASSGPNGPRASEPSCNSPAASGSRARVGIDEALACAQRQVAICRDDGVEVAALFAMSNVTFMEIVAGRPRKRRARAEAIARLHELGADAGAGHLYFSELSRCSCSTGSTKRVAPAQGRIRACCAKATITGCCCRSRCSTRCRAGSMPPARIAGFDDSIAAAQRRKSDRLRPLVGSRLDALLATPQRGAGTARS